jgi:hypothetical protein
MLENSIAGARRILKEAQQTFSVESAAAIEQVYNDIVNLDDFIGKEINAIEADLDFDAGGKQRARRELFERAGRKFEAIKAKRNYSHLDEELEAKLIREPVREEESLIQYLKEREIRDRLFGMTQAQILSIFGESLFDGSNPLVSDAILKSPRGFEMVSEDILKKMRRARAAKISPEIAKELQTVHQLNSTVEKMLTLVRQELDRLRSKELPASLKQTKSPQDAPFRF